MSRLMTKPTKWLCAQRRLRSAWASAHSDQSLRMKKAWVLSYPLSAQRRRRSDWVGAQADLNLRWVHSHLLALSWEGSYYLNSKEILLYILNCTLQFISSLRLLKSEKKGLTDNWAEIHKYYEECDWSKAVGRRIAENFNLKGLHRLDINDYLSAFFFIWCN